MFFPVVSVTDTETVEHNRVHICQSLNWSAIPNFARQGKFQLARFKEEIATKIYYP